MGRKKATVERITSVVRPEGCAKVLLQLIAALFLLSVLGRLFL